MNDHVLEVKDYYYTYYSKEGNRMILKEINHSFSAGRFYALLGESGSGKTTFLSSLAGIDDRYEGQILFFGRDIKEIGLTRFRRSGISIVFQNFNIIGDLNAVDNIVLAMRISDNVDDVNKDKILSVLDTLGINRQKALRKTNRLSQGEQQRVAIARSVLTDSPIILADEPTGNLDWKLAQEINQLFITMAHDYGKCVIMATHNENLAREADEIMRIDQQTGSIMKIQRDINYSW